MMQVDILTLGDYFFDQIFTGMPEFPALGREICATELTTTGGAMFITAAALTRLGARVGWPAYFGNDSYSQFVYALAQREGIDLTLAKIVDRPYRLVTTSVPFQGERAFITYADPEPEDLHQHWLAGMARCTFKHLHLGGMMPPAKMQPLIAAARAKGATVSADCQDGPHLDKPCVCRDMLAQLDIFMPNAREAMIVTEADSVEQAARRLMEIVPLVVIKDGAKGAWLGSSDSVSHAPAVCAGTVVDTTGAGDCFNAGFLYGRVVEGAPLEVCARYGNICGGRSVTAVGGATAAPTREQLTTWVGASGQG